jgi:hypothetical protein
VAFNLTLKNLGASQITSDTQDDQQSFFAFKNYDFNAFGTEKVMTNSKITLYKTLLSNLIDTLKSIKLLL